MSIEKQVSDVTIGFLDDGPLQCRVSVRGGRTIVLTLLRDGRVGIEVGFSPQAMRKLTEVTDVAIKLVGGEPMERLQ